MVKKGMRTAENKEKALKKLSDKEKHEKKIEDLAKLAEPYREFLIKRKIIKTGYEDKRVIASLIVDEIKKRLQ